MLPIHSKLSLDLFKNISSHSHPLCTPNNPMEATKSSNETTIHIPESKSARSKATSAPPPPPPAGGWKRGVAIFDFILRLCGITAALAATTTMGTTDQTLPFFTQFFQFQASYDDLPTFQYVKIPDLVQFLELVLQNSFFKICLVLWFSKLLF